MPTDEIDIDERERVTYMAGWKAYDRGGARSKARRRFAHLVGFNPDALELWDAGWADNQHGRTYGTSHHTTQETR